MPVTRNVYVDEFFDSYCAADLLPFYGNYMTARERNKEITESMSCFHGALDYLAIDRKDKNTIVLVIGDGKYPRTGSVFAFFTSWVVISIDPMLDLIFHDAYSKFKETIGRPIQRLHLRPTIFEEMSLPSFGGVNIVVVLPHSHVSFEEMVKKMASCGNEELEYKVVALPCCVKIPEKLHTKKALDKINFIRYTDSNVLSERREMFVFPKMSKPIYEELMRKNKR